MTVYTLANGEVCVSVPLSGTDPVEKQLLATVGLGHFALLNRTGVIKDCCIEKIEDNKYTRALSEIKDEEERGLLSDGTTYHVLSLIIAGEFDTSDWALWYGLAPDNHQLET